MAGAGPVGLAAAASARILGAAVVLIGDLDPERLAHAKSVGFDVDLRQSDNLGDLIASIIGEPEVDASIDAVGFEAKEVTAMPIPPKPLQRFSTRFDDHASCRRHRYPGLYVTGIRGRRMKAHNTEILRCASVLDGPNRIGSIPDRHPY